MKEIIYYQDNTGHVWPTEEKCLQIDDLITKVDAIMSKLNPKPDDTDFTNGHGYIQQDKEACDTVRLELLELTRQYINHCWVDKTIESGCDVSGVARLVEDSELPPLSSAFYRVLCIDNHYREWGQIYYAHNPDQAREYKEWS